MERLALIDVKNDFDRKIFNFNYCFNKNTKKRVTLRINKSGSGVMVFTKNNAIKKCSNSFNKCFQEFKELKTILRIFNVDIYVKESYESNHNSNKFYLSSFRKTKNLIFKSLEKIKAYESTFNLMKNKSQNSEKILTEKQMIEKSNIDSNKIVHSVTLTVMYLLALLLIFIVFNYFSGDFQKIKDKINYENELELGKLNYDYESNKCDVNGNLPAIAEKCKSLSRKIKLFEKDTISNLSIFFVMLADSINHVYKNIEIKLFIAIFGFIYILKRF